MNNLTVRTPTIEEQVDKGTEQILDGIQFMSMKFVHGMFVEMTKTHNAIQAKIDRIDEIMNLVKQAEADVAAVAKIKEAFNAK